MEERLAAKHIVLLGIGHTNAHIVRMWGMHPIPDADLTCITDNPIATYSGMLPAVLAEQVPPEDMQIDLVRLCASVGARLVIGSVTSVDAAEQFVHVEGRPAIPFDALSIGIGSVPSMVDVTFEGSSLVKIKPMQTFLGRLAAACEAALKRKNSESDSSASRATKLDVVVVGSGVAGVEISFCLAPFLKKKCSSFRIRMVTRSQEILPGATKGFRQRVLAKLKEREVPVSHSFNVASVTQSNVTSTEGEVVDADLVIWATGAVPPPLLEHVNLPKDDAGFLATDQTLRSTSGRPVFAVGDTGSIATESLPKAGVYAVRQGPILWENVRRLMKEQSLLPYRPQQSFLKLLNTGDGNAIGERSGISFSGRWVMRLKEYIDSKFMKMYQVSGGMTDDTEPMQCRGCGCKLGGDVLDGALETLKLSSAENEHSLDDAAVIETSFGRVIASTDFFSSPVDDPWLAGRIAALHSASDLVAMGANIKAALANVVVPEGDPRSQRQGLNDLLAGAESEFAAMGARVVGGHTIVGSRWEVGFTVIGEPLSDTLLRKENLKAGDELVITKPVGIGVLLAAHMRSQCSAADYVALTDAMLQRQHPIAQIASECGVSAGTDVTGFGLIGHLIEMLDASQCSADIVLANIPLLPGAAAAFDAGIESSLAPANRHVQGRLHAKADQMQTAAFKALFDPQTCGGLLLGISREQLSPFQQVMQKANLPVFSIGCVKPCGDDRSTVRIV